MDKPKNKTKNGSKSSLTHIQKPKIDYNEKIVINASFENLIKALVTPKKK